MSVKFKDKVFVSPREYKNIQNNTIVKWKKAVEWRVEVYKNKNLLERRSHRNKGALHKTLDDLEKKYPNCVIKSNVKRPNISWYKTPPIEIVPNKELPFSELEEIYIDSQLAEIKRLLSANEIENVHKEKTLSDLESIKYDTLEGLKEIKKLIDKIN